jgi:hypothetical protein
MVRFDHSAQQVIGHALMENRRGLFVDACLTPADGHAERIASLHMVDPRAARPRAITVDIDADPMGIGAALRIRHKIRRNELNEGSVVSNRKCALA